MNPNHISLPVRSPLGMKVGNAVSASPFAPRNVARFDPAAARVYPTLVAPEKRSVWADYQLSSETGKMTRKPKSCTVEGCQRAAVYPLNAPAYCGQHQVWVAQQAVKAITEPAPVVAAPAAQPVAAARAPLLLPAETPSTIEERANEMRRFSRHGEAHEKAFWSTFCTPHAISAAPYPLPATMPWLALIPAEAASLTPGKRLAEKARLLSNGGPVIPNSTPVVTSETSMRTWRHNADIYRPQSTPVAGAMQGS